MSGDMSGLHLAVATPTLIVTHAADPHDHLVQMPGAVTLRTRPAEVGGDRRTELVRPAADRLIGLIDAAFGEQLFDIPQAQRKRGRGPTLRA